MKQHKYLTTTLPYVNAEPHIGFALEIIQADALARLWHLMGHEVFFNTGTDEHGQKIARKADEAGQPRQAYVDHYAASFRRLIPSLGIHPSIHFIRTTDAHHKLAAQEMWRRCKANGDIYKKKYSGLYCVGCESFKTESDLVDGKCPDHQKEPELIEEENYFFALSKYQMYLEEYLSREGVIAPEWRRLEAFNFVKRGLEDFSISREKARLDWGIPVPDDEEQVMYVWFDALTNYISTLGWPEDTESNYKNFWQDGEPMQVAGKDQVRFQSVMWQAMLKSAGLAPTARVIYHGFITSGGQKMSKTIGNVISPFELVERYGTEATRYLLLRHVHPFEDTDITWERLDEWYNANLAKGLGNLVSRIMTMYTTYKEQFPQHSFALELTPEEKILDSNGYREKIEAHDVSGAMETIWGFVSACDKQIAETEPFKLIKTDTKRAVEIIVSLTQELHRIAVLLRPFMPDTSTVIESAIATQTKPENVFPRLL